jgi:hypothetical protein
LTDTPALDYPTAPDGSLLARGQRGGVPDLPARAPSAQQPGSVHWAAMLIFGTAERFVQTLESIVAGQGQLAEADWQRACVLYREWQRRYRLGIIKREPTLNDVAYVLKLDTETFFGRISIAMQGLFSKVAALKAIAAAPELVDLTLDAARDLEKGGKDRELALRIAGVIADKPGLAVNVGVQVNNQITNKGPAPLAQFRETVEELDSAVRDAAIGRAALPPADMTNIVEGEIVEELDKVEVSRNAQTD